jgi:hypothetical protein
VIELISYLGLALLLITGPVFLAQLLSASSRTLVLVVLTAMAVCLIPRAGHSLVYFVRGVVGDVSVASLVLLGVLYFRALTRPLSTHKPVCGQVGWVLLAILLPLYASTLGYWSYDLYAWGYQPQWMLLFTGILMLWAWQVQPALAIAWLLGVISFACGLTTSNNLWDALFDPFMAFAGIAIVASAGVRAMLKKNTAPSVLEISARRQAA